jgi:hypothetical protein
MVLLMARVLKNLDFQPKLGLITQTIGEAWSDLYHFGIICMLVLGIYMFQSYYLFGNSIEDFSDLWSSFNTCFNMLMGNNDHNAEILALRPIAGVIFIYTFILIVFFVLLNILLAILVDAYIKVVENAQTALSVFEEIQSMIQSQVKGLECYRKRDKAQKDLIHVDDREILDAMGYDSADDEEELDESGRVKGSHLKAKTIFEVPISEDADERLEAHPGTMLKALMIHPQTRNLSRDKQEAIVGNILYRYGQLEKKPKVPNVSDAMGQALEDRKNKLESLGLITEDESTPLVQDTATSPLGGGRRDAENINGSGDAPTIDGFNGSVAAGGNGKRAFYHAPSFTAPAGMEGFVQPKPPATMDSLYGNPAEEAPTTTMQSFPSFMPSFEFGGCSRVPAQPIQHVETGLETIGATGDPLEMKDD